MDEDYSWCYYVLLDKDNDYTPVIKVTSKDEKVKYCYCNNKACKNMVMCDFCKTWYHYPVCIDDYEP